jgi:hypothetical protein
MFKRNRVDTESNVNFNVEEERSYEDYAPEFYVDYDRANPITSEAGYE